MLHFLEGTEILVPSLGILDEIMMNADIYEPVFLMTYLKFLK